MTESLLVLALALVFADSGPESPLTSQKVEPASPKFTYKFNKTGAEIRVLLKKGVIVFRITGKGGTGAAEIMLKEGSWTKDMILQFLKAGPYLEYLRVSNGRISLQGSLRVSPKSIWSYDNDGRHVEDRSKAFYTMMIQYKEKEDVLEVVLPQNFCSSETKALRIEWIDAFRR